MSKGGGDMVMPSKDKRALLVVDVQRDFCEGGSLAVAGGNKVAKDIRTYLDAAGDQYGLVIASRDWHNPPSWDTALNCGHFAAEGTDPDYMTTWPVHCVAGTEGAYYNKALENGDFDIEVRKGQGVPAYSAFEGSIAWDYPRGGVVVSGGHPSGTFTGATLGSVLRGLDIQALDVCGLALDYCVKASALDAVALGISRVAVLRELTAAVSTEGEEAADQALWHNSVVSVR